MLEVLKLIVFGAIVGVANVIPGVSGGTMAVILGIYDQFIEGISLRNFKKNWKFLLPLGIGMVIAVLLFSKGVDYLLGAWPVPTRFAFLGMILGSIPAMFFKARRTGFGAKGIVGFIVAFALMLVLYFVNPASNEGAALPAVSFGLAAYLFVAGAVSSFAMLLPGISGSFTMLIFGVYYIFIGGVSGFTDFDALFTAGWWNCVWLLVPLGLGILTGLLGGSRLTDALLRKQPQIVWYAILGLVIGSLLNVFPGFAASITQNVIAVVLCLGFAALAFWFGKKEL